MKNLFKVGVWEEKRKKPLHFWHGDIDYKSEPLAYAVQAYRLPSLLKKESLMGKIAAVVLAGGRGSRAGQGMPKQYREIRGVSLLRRSLIAFCNHPEIDLVRAVIHPEDEHLYDMVARDLPLEPPVFGGDTRQKSGFNGLESFIEHSPSKILIHDAARPFVAADTITRILRSLDSSTAALAASKITDTVKKQDKAGYVHETLAREELWRAQTPQGFRFEEILAAHIQFRDESYTDDAAIAEAAGHKVLLVDCKEENFKVTNPGDFLRGEVVSSTEEKATHKIADLSGIRMGIGFDVHRFGPGDHVILCGVPIPHTHGLLAHSDADVAMHAITDAILGGICAGDIGTHFPPSDMKWKGASSDIFLTEAAKMVTQKNGAINHIDLTIVCETPKIGPHREAMQSRLGEILNMSSELISIKGTTSERLGFTGRREGIAAQAAATIWIK